MPHTNMKFNNRCCSYLCASLLSLSLYACDGDISEVTAARIIAADTEPHNWLTHGRTYAEQRFSSLTIINEHNIGQLGVAWSYATKSYRGLEATPLIIDGIMYTTGAWSVVHALDAATGELLWKYDPQVPREWASKGCCDVVNRGVAVWKGKVYSATFDGRLIALNRFTGKLLWEKNTIDRSKPYTITGAPRVVKDKVIIGNGGADFGVRGYVSAYDSNNGDIIWRFYTVPGSVTGPFEQPGLADAVKTWDSTGAWLQTGGGGTVWDSMAYDPELNMLYVGSGNGHPHARHVRSPKGGDNLYLSSILALDPDNGELLWYYQTTPADNWDFTATQHIILTDLVINGAKRKILMQAPKNGFFYVLDRITGELLSADKYVAVNWASHVDLATGRPVETGQGDSSTEDKLVYPSELGGHNWQPMSYSPLTGLVYFSALEMPWIHSPKNFYLFDYQVPNIEEFRQGQPIVEQGGYLKAWDPVRRQLAWQVKHKTMVNGGVLSTAGNLVFQGTEEGYLHAYRATDGELLHSIFLGTGVIAPPITYTVAGQQYIALMAGFGGATVGMIDNNAAARRFQNNGYVLTFKLNGGEITLPPELSTKELSSVSAKPTTAETIALGKHLYVKYCGFCHGMFGSKSILPDLHYMSPATHSIFKEIVLGGVYASKGMASFAGVLTEVEVEAIQATIVHETIKMKQNAE